MTLHRHIATRYATPLKEGGSLPAIVEVADGGLWVVKFVGAGQGARALVAEIIVGELARRLGLPVPEVALVDVDAALGRTEGDPEIQDLLRASVGTNVGLRYLDGALNFDPNAAGDLVTAELAADIVWLDAYVTNIDRTVRNPNMLVQREGLWLIDHGAALYFHHAWGSVSPTSVVRPFAQIERHVLLPFAGSLTDAHERAIGRIGPDTLEAVLSMVPDELLMHAPAGSAPPFASPDENRAAYIAALSTRLGSSAFVDAADALRGGR